MLTGASATSTGANTFTAAPTVTASSGNPDPNPTSTATVTGAATITSGLSESGDAELVASLASGGAATVNLTANSQLQVNSSGFTVNMQNGSDVDVANGQSVTLTCGTPGGPPPATLSFTANGPTSTNCVIDPTTGQGAFTGDMSNTTLSMTGTGTLTLASGVGNDIVDMLPTDIVIIAPTDNSSGGPVTVAGNGTISNSDGQSIAAGSGAPISSLYVAGSDSGQTYNAANLGVNAIVDQTGGNTLTNGGLAGVTLVAASGDLLQGGDLSGLIDCDDVTCQVSSSRLVADTNSSFTVDGGGNAITAALGDILSLSGTNGQADTVSASGLDGGADGSITLAADTQATLSGGEDATALNGSSTLTLNGGAGYQVSATSSDTVDAAADTSLTLTGGGVTANLVAGDQLTISGTDGHADTINASDVSNLTLDADTQADIDGRGNTITANLGDTLTLDGGALAPDIVNATGLDGGADGSIILASDSRADLSGMNDAIGLGSGSSLTLEAPANGNFQTITFSEAGAIQETIGNVTDSLRTGIALPNIEVTGSATGQTYDAADYPAGAIVDESGGNTLSTGGASVILVGTNGDMLTGNNDGSTLVADGSGIQMEATDELVTAAEGSSFTVSGGGNSIYARPDENLTLSATGGLTDIVDASGLNGGQDGEIDLGVGATVEVQGSDNLINMDGASGGRGDTLDAYGGGNVITDPNQGNIVLSSTGGVADTVTVSDIDNLTLDANTLANVDGSGNIITLGSNAQADLSGGADTATLGTGATLNLDGDTGYIIDSGTSDTINAGVGASLVVDGGSGLVVLNGDNTLTIGGDSQGYFVDATGDTIAGRVDVTFTVTGNQDVVNLGVGAGLYVNGQGETVNASDDNISIQPDSQVLINGTGDTAYLDGTGDVVTASSATFQLFSDVSSAIKGSDDTVYDTNGSTVTLSGGQDTVAMGTDSALNLDGDTGYIVNSGTSDTITAGAGASLAVAGGSGLVVLDGDNTLTLGGGSQGYFVDATGDTIDGQADTTFTVTGAQNVVNLAATAGLYINGQGETVNATDDNISIQPDSQVLINGTGDTAYLDGTDDVVTASSATFQLFNDVSGYINGSNDTVYLSDGSTFTVTGGQDVVDMGTGSGLYLNGQGETVSATDDNISLYADTQVVIDGTGDSAYLNGGGSTVNASSATIYLNVAGVSEAVDGNDDTFTAGSNPGDDLALSGVGDTATLSDGTLTVGASSSLNVFGGGANVDLLGGDTLGLYSAGDTVSGVSGDAVTDVGASNTFSGSGYTVQLGANNLNLVDSANGLTVFDASGVTGGALALGANGLDVIDDAVGSLGVYQANGASNGTVTLDTSNLNLVDGVSNLTIVDASGVSGGSVQLSTSGLALADDSSNLTFSNGAGASGDIIDLAGGLQATVSSGGDTINTSAGDSLSISNTNGQADIIDASGFGSGAITFGADVQAEIVGNNNQLFLPTDYDEAISFDGSGNTVVSQGGNTIVLSDTFGAGTDTVISSGLPVAGGGNTVELGDNIDLDLSGVGNGVVVLSGAFGDTITQSDVTIDLDGDDDVTIVGTDDTIIGGSGDVLNISGGNNFIYADDSQINGGASDFVYGSDDGGDFSYEGDGDGSGDGDGGDGDGGGDGDLGDPGGDGDTGDPGFPGGGRPPPGGGSSGVPGGAADFVAGARDKLLQDQLSLASRTAVGALADVSMAALQSAAASADDQTPTAGVYEGVKWSQSTITWSFASIGGAFSGGLSPAQQAVVEQAFAAWANASGLHFQQTSDSASADIRIGFSPLGTQTTGIVGYTRYASDNGLLQPGATIQLEDPGETALATDANGQLAYAGTGSELYQVVLHEIGHALGLADDADPNSVMYYASSSANLALDATDRSEIASLYGPSVQAPPLVGTSAGEVLDTKGATDVVQGNGGNDTYVYGQGYGPLTIDNASSTDTGPHGQIQFGAGITSDDLWFDRSGNDLVIDVLGTSNQIEVQNWFGADPTAQTALLATADGETLTASGVDQLIQSMASFEADYQASTGMAFIPTLAGPAITDPAVLAALSSSWKH